MADLNKIYNALREKGVVTKSYEEFANAMADGNKRKNVYNALAQQGLITKSYKQFSDAVAPSHAPQTTQSTSTAPRNNDWVKQGLSVLKGVPSMPTPNIPSYRPTPLKPSEQNFDEIIANGSVYKDDNTYNSVVSGLDERIKQAQQQYDALLKQHSQNVKKGRKEASFWERLGAMPDVDDVPTKTSDDVLTPESDQLRAARETLHRLQNTRVQLERGRESKTQGEELDKRKKNGSGLLERAAYKTAISLENFGKGFMDALRGSDMWATNDAANDLMAVKNIVHKVDKWNALTDKEKSAMTSDDLLKVKPTDEELEILNNYALAYNVNAQAQDPISSNWSYKAGGVSANSALFGIEMAASGGMNVSSSAGRAIEKGALKLSQKAVKNGLEKLVGKTFEKSLARKIAGGVVQLPVQFGMGALESTVLQNGLTERKAQEYEIGTPLMSMDENGVLKYSGSLGKLDAKSAHNRALVEQTIENQTEMLGGQIGEVLGGLTKVGVKVLNKTKLGENITKLMTDVSTNQFNRIMNNALNTAGYNGFLGEYLEEHAGDVEQALFLGTMTFDTDPETGIYNKEHILETMSGLAPMMGGHMVMEGTSYGASRARMAMMLSMAERKGSKLFGDERWAQVKQSLGGLDNQQFADKLSSMLQDKTLSDKQKKAVYNYAFYEKARQGFELMSLKQDMEGAVSLIDKNSRTNFVIGYEKGGQAAGELLTDLQKAQRNLRVRLGDYGYRQLFEENGNDFNKAYNSGMLDTDQKKQAYLDYVNALSCYQGALQRLHNDKKSELVNAKTDVDNIMDEQGNIVSATTTDGKKVNIVNGNVVLNEDGSVNVEKSGSLVVVDSDGKRKMISASEVASVDSVTKASDVLAQKNKEIVDKYATEEMSQKIQVGAQLPILTPNGSGIATIVSVNEDGSVSFKMGDSENIITTDAYNLYVMNLNAEVSSALREDDDAEQSTESAPETATEGGQPLPEEERREYAQGDVFDVVVDGQKMHAEIVSPKDADGRFVVNVDDGESMRTLYVTPEELAAMEYKEPKEEPLTESENPRTIDTEEPPISNAAPTEHTPTALERIPRDEKGNAQFHDVDTETAWDGLVEMSGNEETAHKVAEASLANAEKRLKAAKALNEKGETPEELLRSIKENEAAVAEAQRVVDAWKAIVGEKARREEAAKAEAERVAAEKAEAERKVAEERERAEAEEKARIEAEKKEAERIAAEKAEEEARVEAERKAEEKTEEAESDKEEAEKQMDDEEPKPVGSGVFGNIYNQFKGKVKEAFDFLMKHKGGDLLGVFHRKDVGDIDLVWGDHGGGLAHIIRRHIIEQNDFKNVDEIQKVIEDVIRNGLIVRENKDKINIEYNGYRVSIKKTIRDSKGNVVENKNWIVTAFDKSKPKHEKRNPSSSETLTTPSANQKADGVTLPSNEDSIDKGSKKAEKKQKKQSVFDKAKEITDKEEKKRKAEAEDDSVLGQAARAVGKKKKVNLFKYTASQKDAGEVMKGVHYANGYAYASDGYILFKEKADYPKEWEGTTRDKDGNLIDGKYPDAEKAIHRLVHIPDKEVESLPSKEVLDFAIAASKKLKGEAIPVAIDGIFFNAVNLKKFLEAVASKGMDKVVYRHPMLYATNGKDEIVMMPTVNTLEGALDIADRMERAGLPKEQIDAWKAHIEAADKKMSFEDFKKAVENANKEGDKAERPKQKELTEAERKDAEEVAGALGYRVEWVDTMEENGTIDADKKVIRIAKDAENPLVQVLGHEVAHGVKRMDGGKFKALQKAAMEVVGEKEWNERIEKKRKLNAYAEGKLAEEVTCDIVGEALNDKDALKRLAESLRGEKGILARLRDAVARMVEYFKNRGDKEGVRRMKAADKLLAEFESALKEGVAPEQVKPEGVERSVRESRSEKTELTAEERELRDNLVERMRKGGLDVVTDSEEMQRVIDTENERTRMTGAGSVREHRVYHGSGADFDAFDHSHMGEGEGAQAYGWGTYVTEVEGIGRTYAIQNTTKHNDALRALQHDVDAISDQLNRHRDDLKYDEEQLKRANEWRAEAELDYELFKNEAEELKEKYGESSPKYRNHLFNDIYTDEMKRAQSSVKSMEESIQYRKEKIAELEKALKDKQAEIDELPKEFPRHLYTVEIPDDNGSNYLDWNSSLSKEQKDTITKALKRLKVDLTYYESRGFSLDDTFADIYYFLTIALRHTRKWEDVNAIRASSKFLYSLGFTGIKYPADNMRGGREDGAKNYVIFNENDAKITDHTRFLRTADGEVYGLVKDGRIYLDPKVATAETAVHEYTHLWGDMLRRKDSEQWSHTVKELKNSVLWEEVKELYPELKTDDEIADEVLSTFSGRRGAERLREEARRVADGEGGVFTKAKAIETLERVKEAIARFWEGVARMFGINRYRSAEELADMAMRDLINGVKPTSRTFTFDNFYKDTKAVFEGTERPKGKPDYTSYSGSEYWYGEDKGGKYVVRGSDHWSGEFKVKDGERTNVGRNHYSEITEDRMLPIGAQGSLKFGWEKGLSKPVGSGISAAIDRRGSGDSNNIASCYWYIDNAKEKDNKGFTYGKAYLSEFEDKERRRDIPGDDWRDIQGLEGGTRAMAERIAEQPVEEINNRFNEELEKYQNNELPKGHRFELGMPSAELQSAGFPTLPISMRSSLLAKKAGAERHPFAPTDLRDLVNAIQKPIAIFNYSKNNMRNLIVDVSRGGKHFLVGVTLNYKADNIEINSVSGLFPKENHEWIKWIQDGKVLRIDQKEKVQDLINSLRTNPAESERIGLNLDDVAKKVKDFENPKLFDGKISEVDKKGSDSTDRSVRENPKNEDKPRYSRKPGESIFDYASRVSEDVDRSVRERVSARDEYEKKVKSKGFQTKEALQNSMLGLQEFMLAIDHASGNKRYIEDIPDFENPILGENRLSSVNKEEMHQVAKTQFKPLMSAVAKLSGNGKESGELYDYMFAKHGLERDAVMRQREAQKEFDKYQKANPKGTKTIGDFVASLEGKDYAGLTALTAEDGRVKSIQSQIDAIDEQMKATDDQLLLRKLGGQKKRLKVDLLNAARDAADDIRKAFESNPSHDRSDINELWSRVNEVNGNTLRKLYESGMLTKEAYNDISSMYTNYIPMRGFDQTTSADAYAYLTHGDSAFNAPIKTAKGRSSKADNPIAYMQAMAESAIMQGNRNVLVKQKMLNFVRNHPSDLASVSDVWLQYDSVADEWKPVFPDNIGANDSASVVAKKMEAFEDKMKQMAEKHPDLVQRSNEAPDIPYKVVEKGQLNEHQVLVKQNGKSYIITVNGSPRAAQAANGLTNPDTDLTGAVGKVFEGAEALNRQLSSLYTTLNPDFIGSNYVRDALYSNTMVYVKEGAKYGGSFNLNFAKYNPAEMANLYARYNKGSLDTSNETHRLFLEFMQNGGETGFVNLKQIEKRKSEIAKAIKRDGRISAAQIWGGLGDAVDFANRAVENSARFAAYVTSRKSGRSVGRSVYDAKEISVNFNRKGSGSKFMGAEGQTKAGNAAAFVSGAGRGLYIFWNAGLQGLTNFSRQIGRHPGRALTLAALLFGFGALMSYLGNGDDDDENNYFNLPKYIRRSNVCYKIGDLFVTIPLPVEYRSFYGLGELASSTLAGKEDGTTKDIAKEALSQVSQLFPIDFAEGGGGLHALIPSAVKPIVEAETNTAWTGLPIYKDNDFNKNMPEYTKVYKTANKYLVEIARALNDATGGNKYKKGFIDINPAKMEYVLKGMLGGAFSFPDKLVKTTETIMGDREFDWRNTPFANRFVKNADERTEYKSLNEQYFKLKDEMDVVKQQLKGFEKEADAGNEKYEKALLQLEDSKDYERLELFKDYEKELKGLNDELKELRMSPDYDKAEEKELQKEIAELQRQLIDEMREIKK